MAGPGSALPTPSRACPRPQPTVQPGAGPRGPHACLKGLLAVLHSPGGRGGAAGGGGGTGWCQAPSSGCGGSAGPSGWAVPGPTRTRGGKGSSHLWEHLPEEIPSEGRSLQRHSRDYTPAPTESPRALPLCWLTGQLWGAGTMNSWCPRDPGQEGARGAHHLILAEAGAGAGRAPAPKRARGPEESPGQHAGAGPWPWAEAGRWSARVAAGSRVYLWSPRLKTHSQLCPPPLAWPWARPS